ncbi:MAG: FKBP-type peptidyl-prolyl cis-trans isomerase [Planctomycetota bacterium]
MNRILSIAALALGSAAAFAAVLPIVGGGQDLTKIPDPAAREKEIAAMPVKLVDAIGRAAKDGGVVSAASFSATGQIELTLLHDGAEQALIIDGKSGEVVSTTPIPLFPGDPVSGLGTTTATGLRYYDIKVGDGAEAPSKTGTATVHYTGWLLNGTQFDSSVPRRQPFPVNLAGGVIPGWLEGIPGMKVGGKRKLVIPGNLAYGPAGRAPTIPPNAVLVFDVELLKVN